ncbi:MAG: hypothetical protein ABF812_14055 [Gluconobacter cerinus]|uniref:hypothetical protein n=1 Tax=Gluconobacter cerinus TaxID=38307 RepID=UPI0039E86EE4
MSDTNGISLGTVARQLTRKLTVATLCEANILKQLPKKKADARDFFYTRQWSHHINLLPSDMRSDDQRDRSTPLQQQPLLLARRFVAKESLETLEIMGMYPVFDPMRPEGCCVWEMRTKDTRTFGWFKCKNAFVAVCAGPIWLFKDENNKSIDATYAKFKKQVTDFISSSVLKSEVSQENDTNLLVD